VEIQLSRIKEKLASIQAYDKDLVVFGADSHGYQVGPGVSETEVTAFEAAYNIQLPEAYAAFLMHIGNGNTEEEAYMDSAAGPYYGIYPLGEGLEDLMTNDVKRFICSPCLLHPSMTEEAWSSLVAPTQDDTLSDTAYYEKIGVLFGGLMPIGTQGCAITTCLIVTGAYRGRIVYINEDYLPVFAYETHFLDWYERWLDEIISGDLVSENAGWFGYSIGGTSAFLWRAFQTSTDETEQEIYLDALIKKRTIETPIIQEIVHVIPQATTTIALRLTSIMAKVDFEKALPFLEQQLPNHLLFVLQQIHWYGKDESDWLTVLEPYKDKITDEETYRFYTYVVEKATADFASLIVPGLDSEVAEIRGQAVYTLGKSSRKQDYVSSFITALQDDDDPVVLYSLQALKGVEDERLLPLYAAVYQKYKDREDENYILTNLKHRLEEMQITLEDLQA